MNTLEIKELAVLAVKAILLIPVVIFMCIFAALIEPEDK